VNPVLSPPGSRHTVNALTFDGPHLNVRWIAEPARRDPFPVPLLAGCFLAVRREVFRAAGGFDAGMTGYGAEDLELCLRLWRMGYECLSVPGARVEHWFKPAQTHRGDRAGFLHNLLRLGSLHLAPWRLALLVTALRREPEFPRAMAAVLAGDVGRQRARTGAASWFSDDVFFERFGPGCYEVAPRASNHTPEEVA
jgi:cellulose synthase/poly-beta-1,6-N-acetylglucosamine synthase-like glycosyltransferase